MRDNRRNRVRDVNKFILKDLNRKRRFVESVYLLLLLSFASRAFVFHAHAIESAYRGYTLYPGSLQSCERPCENLSFSYRITREFFDVRSKYETMSPGCLLFTLKLNASRCRFKLNTILLSTGSRSHFTITSVSMFLPITSAIVNFTKDTFYNQCRYFICLDKRNYIFLLTFTIDDFWDSS